MKYMGSKNRISKYLLPIILKDRTPDQWYVEPFVGGGNMIDKVCGEKRIGSDNNLCLIEALKIIRDDVMSLPKDKNETDEDKYKEIKLYDDCGIKGYYAFALSYGGKWFGGWRRDKDNKRDYIKEAYNNAIKQSPKLNGVELTCCEYYKLKIPNKSIIYCDPPYFNTTKYKNNFDHVKFWDWCRDKSKEGHDIFISEYNAPDDFECVWEKQIVSSLTKNTGNKIGSEKLFIFKNKRLEIK